ncbi:MAG: hypothetical protein ACI4OY_02955 [Aristaeellaceae bacterium]
MLSGIPLRPGLLESVLHLRQRERLQMDYALHLLWLMGLQLFTLGGGQDYPVPDPVQALSMDAPADTASAQTIRSRVLRALREERS